MIRTVHRITSANQPMSVYYVRMYGGVIATVIAAEGPLRAFLSLVTTHGSPVEPTPTLVDAFQLHVLAPRELAVRFRIQIQVPLVVSQLTGPFASLLPVRAGDTELRQRPLQALVVKHGKGVGIAERARFPPIRNLLYALLTVILPTAANQVRLSQDQETDGTRGLHQSRGRRGLQEFAVVPALVVVGSQGSWQGWA